MSKFASFMAEFQGWWQGKKTIVGGGLIMAAAVWAVFAGRLDAQTGLALLGLGLSVAGMGAKANRHQAELLAALQGVAKAGTDYRSGGGARAAIADAEAVAAQQLPAALAAEVSTMDALRRGERFPPPISVGYAPSAAPTHFGTALFPLLLAIAFFSAGALRAQTTVIHVPVPPGYDIHQVAELLIGSYHSPGDNLETVDVTAISHAAKTVDLAAFSLTDAPIVEALAGDAKRGVTVRIYLDRGEVEAECRGDSSCAGIPLRELIGLPGVEIRVKQSKVLMHLKSYSVDGYLVRDGSADFSEAGERRQDNSAVFSTDGRAVGTFGVKFSEMWGRPDNLTVAQAVGGTGK